MADPIRVILSLGLLFSWCGMGWYVTSGRCSRIPVRVRVPTAPLTTTTPACAPVAVATAEPSRGSVDVDLEDFVPLSNRLLDTLRPLCRQIDHRTFVGEVAGPLLWRRSNRSKSHSGPKVGDAGRWIIQPNYAYVIDRGLASALAMIFSRKSVLELGAGQGCYTKALYETRALKNITAIEGAENIEELSGGAIKQADLSKPFETDVVDWVLCTEVGEHVPKEFETVLISNIVKHAREGVVLTWAWKNGGAGHVNMKEPWQIIQLLAREASLWT